MKMRVGEVDFDSLPIETQVKLIVDKENRERKEDWIVSGLCLAMMLTVTVPTLNIGLDRLMGFSSTANQESSKPTENKIVGTAPTRGAASKWTERVYPGAKLPRGLVAGNRSFFPCDETGPCTVHPITKKKGRHRGQDVGAPHGIPLYPVSEFTDTVSVECLSQPSGAGNYAVITPTKAGKPYGDIYYITMHLSACYPGKNIKIGTVIGSVGSTGMSTAPHVHFEQWVKGKAERPSANALIMHLQGKRP